MPSVLELVEQIVGFVDQAVAGGYVLALGLVCLLQYMLYVTRRMQVRQHLQRCRLEMQGMQDELSSIQKDQTLTQLENQILREFVEQTELDQALTLLLRRFIPDPQQGFAAFISYGVGRNTIERSRGLSEQSLAAFEVDSELKERVDQERIVRLTSVELLEHRLLSGLSLADRGKVREIYLVGVGAPGEMSSLLVTTALYPAGASQEQKFELAVRLMMGIAGNIKHAHELEHQQFQLRMASEMLELRSITDSQHATPIEMLEAFLSCLREKTGADRAALYLVSQGNGVANRPLLRCGGTQQRGVESRWQEHEATIARSGIAGAEPSTFDKRELLILGVDSLVNSALVAPLMQGENIIGVICFTRSAQQPFEEIEKNLTFWASEHIADTIVRVLNHAAVERQARQDGLTELANRREFDRFSKQELKAAKKAGYECSLLLIDLDRFKSINDTFGHQAGDEVLRATANILRDQVSRLRSDDRALLARYGGEEMAVLLPSIGLAGANRIAEMIRSAIEGTAINFQQCELQITASVGIATFPQHARGADDLVSAADSALYQAKESGRNQVCSAAPLLV